MQLQVSDSIIHQFYSSATATSKGIGLRLAAEPHAATEQLVTLLTELTDVYNAKPAKGYASFIGAEEDGDAGEFPELLQQWLSQQMSFLDYSQAAARLLHQQLEKHGILEEGFLLLAHYQHMTNDFLTVGFLPSKDGVTIGPDLAVDKSSQLDISRVQLAARIDLTELKLDPDSRSYISFIKGRAGRKVSDFFLDFLGCSERVNAKAQTQQLVDQVQAYAQVESLPNEAAVAMRKQVYDYCDEQWQQGEQVRVKDLSEQLRGSVPSERSFADFSREQTPEEMRLHDEFPADKSTLRKLVKFSGQGGGLSVGFDQGMLGERVKYDPATDTLTVHGTPPNLRDQLRRFFGIDS